VPRCGSVAVIRRMLSLQSARNGGPHRFIAERSPALAVLRLRRVAGRVDSRRSGAHSLHAYFLRPGDPAVPIIYDVQHLREGRWRPEQCRRCAGAQRRRDRAAVDDRAQSPGSGPRAPPRHGVTHQVKPPLPIDRRATKLTLLFVGPGTC
jgi:hypothetical protein